MRRQGIVFPPHFLDGCVHFPHGLAGRCEGILQAIWAHLFKHCRLEPPKRSVFYRVI